MIVERGRGRALVWIVCAVGAALGAFLFFFNPSEHAFYPRCFLKMSTGLDCPGCGGLRATHQLLHGHVREAFALNPLFVIALPLAALFVGGLWIGKLTGNPISRILPTARVAWICAVVVIAFGVLRNVPWRTWFCIVSAIALR